MTGEDRVSFTKEINADQINFILLLGLIIKY
jgi:hypothetical protein